MSNLCGVMDTPIKFIMSLNQVGEKSSLMVLDGLMALGAAPWAWRNHGGVDWSLFHLFENTDKDTFVE